MEQYLRKQPSPEDRVEIAIATLCTLFFNAHYKGDRTVKDYLPYYNPWPMISRYSDLDIEIMQALGM